MFRNVAVIIPAYNESSIIHDVICGIKPYVAFTRQIVVIDDGSSDSTYSACRNEDVILLRHRINLGQGAALQTGLQYALHHTDAEYFVTFDADGQHDPQNIPNLLDPLLANKCDVVLGSRFIENSKTPNMPFCRKVFLKMATKITSMTTGLKLTDTHNGCRAFSYNAASKFEIAQNRMAHASEILSHIATANLSYCEVPVTIHYTSYSMTKGQSLHSSVEILLDLLRGKFK